MHMRHRARTESVACGLPHLRHTPCRASAGPLLPYLVLIAAAVSCLAVAGGLQEAYAQSSVEVSPVGDLENNNSRLLDGATGVDVFTIGDRTYAVVAARDDDGIQIVDITNPASPTAAGNLGDDNSRLLDGAHGVAVFTIGDRTYAVVAARFSDGIQIVDITNPASPAAAGNLADTEGDNELLLDGARGVDTFTIGGKTYAAVASFIDDGIQIVDVSNPASPAAAGNLGNTGSLELDGATGVDVFTKGGKTYAAVASWLDDGIQIVDVSNPASPTAAGNLGDRGIRELDGAIGVAAFQRGSKAFLAVASVDDDGLEIVDVTSPHGPTAAGRLDDDGSRLLDGAYGVDVFTIGSRTYAAAASSVDDGIQIIHVSDPTAAHTVGKLGDNNSLELDGATDVDVFTIGGGTYAAVVSQNDDGLQMVIIGKQGAPEFASATLDDNTGTMTITFSEVIDVSDTDLSKIYVSDAGQTNGVSMSGATFDDAVPDSETISITLTRAQLDGIAAMRVPQLDIAAGAVEDHAGHHIGTARDKTVTTASPDSPIPAGRLPDGAGLYLEKSRGVDTFTIGSNAYAVAVSSTEDGLQIVDITNPARLTPAGNMRDAHNSLLDGARAVDTFTKGSKTYATVASHAEDGIQIVDVSNPASPKPTGNMGVYASSRLLDGANGVSNFKIDGGTYAAVTSQYDGGLQIIDVTKPNNPAESGRLEDSTSRLLEDTSSVDTFRRGGSTYAVVASWGDDGLEIIDVSNPSSPAETGRLADDNDVLLRGIRAVDAFEAGGSAYVAVASHPENGLQIVDVSDPASPSPAGKLADGGDRLLGGASGVEIFVVDQAIYAAVASQSDDGLQIVDVSDPDNPAEAGSLRDGPGLSLDAARDLSVFTRNGDTYAVVASDTEGLQTVKLAEAPNSPPVAPDETASTAEDTPVTITPAISDPDTSDTPVISAVVDPPNGTATHDDDTITYTPDQDYEGTDTFEYTVSDGTGTTQGTVTVTVTRDNNDPVLGTIGDQTATPDVQLTITPTVTDADPTDTHTYSITRGTLPAAAAFTASDGTLVWTPVSADAGQTHEVTITVNDGRSGTDSETFDIVVPAAITLTPVGSLDDSPQLLLHGAFGVDVFTIGSNTYAVVASEYDDGIQLVDITNPASPAAAGSLNDTGSTVLDGPQGVDVFTIGSNTYAAVASFVDGGIQIIDITNPASPAAAGNLTDTGSSVLDGARDVDVFTIGSNTYAAVVSLDEDGIQLVDITNPASPAAAGSLDDTGSTVLGGARGVDVFTIGSNTYAAVAAEYEDGIQLVDVTNPASPVAAGSLKEGQGGSQDLDGSYAVDTFTIGSNTYAAVVGEADNGLQIVDITNPASLTATGSIGDTGTTRLKSPRGVDVFTIDSSTYAIVASAHNNGIQLVDITNPASPIQAGNLGDTGSLELLSPRGVAVFTIGQDVYAAVAAFGDHGLQLVRLGGEAETPNSLPVAPDETATTAEDTPITITPTISDPDTSDTPMISAVENPPNGSVIHDDTTITYTPDQGYTGTDTFGYTVTDGTDSVQGTVTVTVTRDNNTSKAISDLLSIYHARPDLQAAYPEAGSGDDMTRLLRWAWQYGIVDYPADPNGPHAVLGPHAHTYALLSIYDARPDLQAAYPEVVAGDRDALTVWARDWGINDYPDDPVGPAAVLGPHAHTYALLSIYDARPDLQAAYPEVVAGDRDALTVWARDWGINDYPDDPVGPAAVLGPHAHTYALLSIYDARPDLQAAYPEVVAGDRDALTVWARDWGINDYPDDPVGPAAVLGPHAHTYALLSIYDARPDLQAAYPEVVAGDRDALTVWARDWGINDYPDDPVGPAAVLGPHAHTYALLSIYDARPDLQAAYPEVVAGDRDALTVWARDWGINDYPDDPVGPAAVLGPHAHTYALLSIYDARPDLQAAYPEVVAGDRDALTVWARDWGINDYPDDPVGPAAVLGSHAHTYALLSIYDARPDLQAAYPEVVAGDRDALIKWIRDYGITEYPSVLGPYAHIYGRD